MEDRKSISRRAFLGASAGGLLAFGLGDISAWAAGGDKADLVIHGAPVLTVDGTNTVRGAVAVKGNRILALSKDLPGLQDLIGSGTRVARLTSGSVTPGIIDVHNHIVAQAISTTNWIDLIQCGNAAMVREKIARRILEGDIRPGTWILCTGYMWLWDKMGARAREGIKGPTLLDRWDIDQIVDVGGKKIDLGKYPVWLVQLSGHYATCNGLALLRSKIMDDSGKFYRGKDGPCLTVPNKEIGEAFSPEGHAFGSFFSVSSKNGSKQIDGMVFHHYAMEEFLYRASRFAGFPQLDEEEFSSGLKTRSRQFIRMGVTSIYDNNLRAISMLSEIRKHQEKVDPEDRLRLTFHPYICHPDKGAFPAFDSGHKKGVVARAPLFADSWARCIGYKLQIDAAAMTGFTWEPNRSLGDATKGKLNLWDYRDYLETIKSLHGLGAQLSIHVVGDKALDWTLDAYAGAGIGGCGRRHRLEHLPCVPDVSMNTTKGAREPLYPRARDLALVFCPQPGFILYYAAFWEQAFGAGIGRMKEDKIYPRVTHSIPYRSAIEAGIPVALSSDSPCVPNASPVLALWESVHRRTARLAKGGQVFLESFVYNHRDEKGNSIDERVDFDQALRGHTIDAAFCGHEETALGSLEPGKLADLVVWNRDIRMIGGRVPVGQVQKIKPVMTIIDGRVVYRDESAGIVIEKA